MRTAASERALDNGVGIPGMGDGRTLDAIKRMLPAHARELTGDRVGMRAQKLISRTALCSL